MKLRIASVVGAMALSLCATSHFSNDMALAQSESPGKRAEKAEKAGAEGGRVPAYFAQIGLTKEQRTKVIEVQNSYQEKIDALKKQIEDLEKKRDVDVRAPLTDEQKKKVDELTEAGKKKAAETRSKGKAADTPKKPDSTKESK